MFKITILDNSLYTFYGKWVHPNHPLTRIQNMKIRKQIKKSRLSCDGKQFKKRIFLCKQSIIMSSPNVLGSWGNVNQIISQVLLIYFFVKQDGF